MSTIHAALVAVAVLLGVAAPGRATEPVSLDDAFARVLAGHPDLEALHYATTGLEAEAESAAQKPAFALVADLENAPGGGQAAGFGRAEATLSLASVLERGGKRQARMALALTRLDGIELLREGKRLDLLAEVARRYLDAVAAKAETALAQEDAVQRRTILAAVEKRVAAGGVPVSLNLGAEAAALRSEADAARAQRRVIAALRRLALLWGGSGDIELASFNTSILPAVPEYEEAVTQLAQSPELRRFAHEARLREARLRLAQTAKTPDVAWQFGVRRLQEERDFGLVGSVSIPLGSTIRAAPELRAAQAELAALDLQREGEQRAVEATLAQAWSQLDQSVAIARELDEKLLPQLQRAEAAAGRSFRAGASDYLTWAQFQTDVLQARRERLAAALDAQRALIELQRLTGRAFSAAADMQESTP